MITRRKASDSDREFARQLHHIAYRDVIMQQFGSWDEGAQDAFFANGWSPDKFEIISAQGSPCGYYSVEMKDKAIEIVEIVLHPDFQNQGIGTGIIVKEIATAHKSGLDLILKTLRDNQAQKLYQRLGFTIYGHTETHVLMRHAGTAASPASRS